MNSKTVPMTIFSVVLLAYSAWRSFDYMKGSLQGVDLLTATLVSCTFLFVTEVGLLVWLHKGIPSATTQTQEIAAQGLVWIDFVGAMIVGLGDILRYNTMFDASFLDFIDPIILLAPWVLIAANVAGYLIYHQADSEHQLEREERRLEHEEHQLEVNARRMAIKEIRQNSKATTEKLAPHYVKDIIDRVTGRTAARFGKRAQQLTAEQAAPSTNGKQGAAPDEDPKNG